MCCTLHIVSMEPTATASDPAFILCKFQNSNVRPTIVLQCNLSLWTNCRPTETLWITTKLIYLKTLKAITHTPFFYQCHFPKTRQTKNSKPEEKKTTQIYPNDFHQIINSIGQFWLYKHSSENWKILVFRFALVIIFRVACIFFFLFTFIPCKILSLNGKFWINKLKIWIIQWRKRATTTTTMTTTQVGQSCRPYDCYACLLICLMLVPSLSSSSSFWHAVTSTVHFICLCFSQFSSLFHSVQFSYLHTWKTNVQTEISKTFGKWISWKLQTIQNMLFRIEFVALQ